MGRYDVVLYFWVRLTSLDIFGIKCSRLCHCGGLLEAGVTLLGHAVITSSNVVAQLEL